MGAPWVILYSIFWVLRERDLLFYFLFLNFNLGFASLGFCQDMHLIFILVEKGEFEIRGDVWRGKMLPFVHWGLFGPREVVLLMGKRHLHMKLKQSSFLTFIYFT
jgi:hypothetical protein